MNKIFVVSLSTEASVPQTDTVLEAGIDRGAAATAVSAPSQTGQWMMRLADQNLWRFAEVPVEVVDTLDEAESEAVSGRDIKPRDGTWTVAIGNTALQGCPAMIADQIRNAGMQGRSNSRNIKCTSRTNATWNWQG